MNQILTVSELTKRIKVTLEEGFSALSVTGEISGFKHHASSGHWYFNLKDANAVICCTMWKGNNNSVFFTPQDGMKVVISGRITVYPPRGNYQIDVRSMRVSGVGELQAAFEQLKQKLLAEGLFNKEHKKPVPAISKRIGIVTASDGAALQDMISVAQRRFPLVELTLFPARVQGSGAAESVIEGLNYFNEERKVDVIILVRGGGSIEDLWAFNEEILARAIFESRIPVITGVGHEVDFTIADFVADLRAPTPSAAMEILTPDKTDILVFLDEFTSSALDCLDSALESKKKKVHDALNSYGFRVPMDIVRKRSQETDNILYIISQKVEKRLMIKKNILSLLEKTIDSHNVQKTLQKGFALVKQDSKYVKNLAGFDPQVDVGLRFWDGEITIKVQE